MATSFLYRLAPFVTVFLLALIWLALVKILQLPSHLLPSPERVAARLWDGVVVSGDMNRHLASTIWSATLGFLLGGTVAVTVGVLLDASSTAERIFYPLLAGIQSMPKVALAPLILVWAGFGTQSIVILVALICFYPMFVATFGGLRAVDRNLIALCRVSSASSLFILFHVKLPSALGHILTGCEVAVAFALVGCVVMEFIIGTGGAGFLIDNSANSLDTTTAVATMIALGVIGAIMATLVRLVHRMVVFWEGDKRTTGSAAAGATA